jgi:hypothetical protein
MEMIQPNKLKQAQAELQTINFSNGFEIPTEIQKRGSDSVYQCICIKAFDSVDGFSKLYEGKLVPASTRMWNKMQRHKQKGIYKEVFNNMFDKVVLLHDPTYKAPKQEKLKDLSPKQKGEVNKLKEEGKTLEEISTITGYDIKRIKAYLNA